MDAARPGEGVVIPRVLLRFLERASIAYAATSDPFRAPHFHWACGWAAEPSGRILSFLVAEPFADGLLRNVEASPRIAFTVEHVGPHETYQFKGDFVAAGAVGPAERAVHEGCRDRFWRDVQAIETRFLFSQEALERYYGAPGLAVKMSIREIFLQTPGPGAGRRLVPPEAR